MEIVRDASPITLKAQKPPHNDWAMTSRLTIPSPTCHYKITGTPSGSVHAEPKKACEPPTLHTRFSKGPKH